MTCHFLAVSALFGGLSVFPTLAQTPPAAGNLVNNGGFEKMSLQDNLWDGVDNEGCLAGFRGGVEAVAESGSFRTLAMPISVAAGDLNGDGLIDLMAASPTGYFVVYFNSGSKTAPVFTHGEQVPLFLTRPEGKFVQAPRINLFDWSRRKQLDLCVGDYAGELFFIPNTGSSGAPEFRQPADLNKIVVPTTKERDLWANLLAPAADDFNHDGRVDVAVGEGSYSANSVHLLLNEGSNNVPKFDAAERFYLAYGDGREHLTPTLADYNGDGEMDVLCADREGEVGVYLHPGAAWKPGSDFKFSSNVQFGGTESLRGLVTVCAADLNGDGLFDLLIGKSNGRIALAMNGGSQTEPRFGAPVDVRGTDIWGRNIRIPNGWNYDVGLSRGNFYAAATCFNEDDEAGLAPPEGKSCLKIGYFASPNKVLKIPVIIVPGDADYQNINSQTLAAEAVMLPGNVFFLRKELPSLKIGSTYVFSFKCKGANASNLKWSLGWRGFKKLAGRKLEAGERGSATVKKFEALDHQDIRGTVPVGKSWSTMSKTFVLEKFENKDLSDLKKATAFLEISGTLTPNSGAFYLDDVQLVEKP